jgi:prophage regulatory protein
MTTAPFGSRIMATVKKRLVTFKELRDYGIPFSRAHVDRLEAAGAFPERIPIGVSRVVWELAEIEEFIAERKRHYRPPTTSE